MRKPSTTTERVGAVLPLVTVCLIALLGFIALAVDVGMMAVPPTQAQSAADIAPLAGVRTLNGSSNNNVPAAIAEAKEAADSNSVLGTQIIDDQVVVARAGVYRYDASAQRFNVDFTNPPGSTE